jgi:carboxyl-terminal processing protease
MNKRAIILAYLLLALSLLTSACIGLLPLEEEPLTGDFGPKVTLQEQQTRTFQTLWNHIEQNYIYYETAGVDWQALEAKYLERINAGLTTEEFVALMEELQADLPAGSFTYQSRAQRIETDTTDLSSYEGIGAFVGFDPEPEPHMILLDVIQGSPAEQAGLRAHDSIFAIDGEPIRLEEGMRAIERIRGPADSVVMLEIRSPGEEARSVEVRRGRLTSTGKLQTFNVRNTNYGYLLFPPVGYNTLGEDVVQSLQVMTSNRVLEGLILDLRIASSSGGWPLETLFTMFYDGELGEFYDRENRELIRVAGQDVFSSQEVPLVVLVGANTTGSPEILAAALQAHERAIVIGQRTPGEIEGSLPFYLPDGSEAFIQTTSFVLPNGQDVGVTGVIPDIEIEVGWDEVLPDQDPVFDRAVEVLDEQ